MQIIETTPLAYDLSRTMLQANPTHTISAGEHAAMFFALDTCDVWTTDGWLVTAVRDDGRTHHLRKGRDHCIATIEPDEVLRYTPNAKALLYLQQR